MSDWVLPRFDPDAHAALIVEPATPETADQMRNAGFGVLVERNGVRPQVRIVNFYGTDLDTVCMELDCYADRYRYRVEYE